MNKQQQLKWEVSMSDRLRAHLEEVPTIENNEQAKIHRDKFTELFGEFCAIMCHHNINHDELLTEQMKTFDEAMRTAKVAYQADLMNGFD